MKSYIALLFLIAAVLMFVACPQQPGTSNSDNSNSENTNVGAEPSADPKDAVVELESKAYEAWKNKDGKFFEGMLADSFVGNGIYTDKASVVKAMNESPCEVKDVKLEDPETVNLTENAVLLTNKIVADFSCGGKPGLSPTWAASIFVKEGDSWKGAYHQSLPAADAKGEGNAPAMPSNAANADDELTKMLSEMENKLWEEWKNKESKFFEESAGPDYLGLSSTGRRDKAASLKESKDNPCEVGSYATGGFKAHRITENVALLTYSATQEAKCGETQLPAKVFSSSVFVKDGDSWKVAFYTESPAA